VSARALGVPRAAKVVKVKGLSGGIRTDIGPRRRLAKGVRRRKFR
jgi:hypothetical protein